jgi:hypothetical protein
MAIDTLKVARRLREAGFSELQADALVAAVQEGAEGADLATKADLALLGNDLRAEITEQRAKITPLRTELRGEMREMEQRLVARMGEMKADIMGRMMTMILTAVLVNVVTVPGAMFAAVRLLAH